MSQKISVLTGTLTALGAISQFRAVGFDGAQATVQGQKVAGVATVKAVDGDDIGVDMVGTTIIEAGAAISVGDGLIIDAQGRAIPTTGEINIPSGATGVASTAANGAILAGGEMPEYVFADALESAAAAGEFIEVLLRR